MTRRVRRVIAALAIPLSAVLLGIAGGCSSPGPAAPSVAAQGPADDGRCSPAEVLKLTAWKLTLPDEEDGRILDEGGKAPQVDQPRLASFSVSPWYRSTADCGAVVFRAPVNGASPRGSSFARSELSEVQPGEDDDAFWSSTAGTHTLTTDAAFTAVPRGVPDVVGVQIVDGTDNVSGFRLEGTRLYATNGPNPHHKLVTDRYVLGTRFRAKFVVTRGEVRVFYNGVPLTVIHRAFSRAHFKVGAYTQSNCETTDPCDTRNFSEVTVYELAATHQ